MTDLHQLEKESLLTAMRTTKNKRLYERYQAVYLYLQNYSKTEIASMIGRSERTIYSYNAYKAKGLSGLIMGRSTGPPRKLTPEQEQELVQVITCKLPVDVGFPSKHNWTLSIITFFIKREWNQSYTLRGVSRLLHDLGLSYTKPAYT
ncbi:helix-turn-helix domain-containing protein, partial [Bacillus thuringiensis]|uniref:helix-turn-helix domain-containing protein n=1 Tax=Bacillus thuringiensis TaxID=1428 RepID=UPI0018CF4467